MKPGFTEVDWSAPFDLDAHLAACPDAATVKGVIMMSVLKQVERKGLPRPAGLGPYLTFKDYPLREHMKLTVDVAKLAFPKTSVRESLRELGWNTFPAMKETLIGKVVFGAVEDPRSVYRAVSKAYEIVGSKAQGKIIEHGPRFVHSHTREAFGFLDTFHVGTAEGVCIALGRKPTLTIKRHSISEAEFFIEW